MSTTTSAAPSSNFSRHLLRLIRVHSPGPVVVQKRQTAGAANSSGAPPRSANVHAVGLMACAASVGTRSLDKNERLGNSRRSTRARARAGPLPLRGELPPADSADMGERAWSPESTGGEDGSYASSASLTALAETAPSAATRWGHSTLAVTHDTHSYLSAALFRTTATGQLLSPQRTTQRDLPYLTDVPGSSDAGRRVEERTSKTSCIVTSIADRVLRKAKSTSRSNTQPEGPRHCSGVLQEQAIFPSSDRSITAAIAGCLRGSRGDRHAPRRSRTPIDPLSDNVHATFLRDPGVMSLYSLRSF